MSRKTPEQWFKGSDKDSNEVLSKEELADLLGSKAHIDVFFKRARLKKTSMCALLPKRSASSSLERTSLLSLSEPLNHCSGVFLDIFHHFTFPKKAENSLRFRPESQGIFCFFRKSKVVEYVQKDT